MIEYQMKTFVCPHCQKMFMKRIADIVRVEKEEERLSLITKIRNADNYLNECPYCSEVFDVGLPLIYIDNVNKLSIQYVPSYAYLDQFLKVAGKNKDYTCRLVVGDTSKFSEKFDIMYSGISDKLLEIYRHELKRILDTNYVAFNLVGEKLLVAARFNDDIKSSLIIKQILDEIYENAKNEEFFTRDNDYIVDDAMFINSIYNTKDQLPVHELIKKERKTVALVRIDDLNIDLYYKTDNNFINVDVLVRVKSEIKKGHILKVESLTEEELGFSFKKLRRISKYIFTYQEYGDLLNHVLKGINTNFTLSYKDAVITKDIYDDYVLNEVITQKGNVLSFIDEAKCESNCRYIIVSPKSNIYLTDKKMIRTMNIVNKYFKVIGKEEIDGIYFIILLALYNEDAILMNKVEMNYKENQEIYDKAWKYIKAATNSTYLLDLKDVNDYNQLIGYSLGEKKVARDILVVEKVVENLNAA